MDQYLVVEASVSRGSILHVKGFRSIDRLEQVDGAVVKLWIRQNTADPAMSAVSLSGGAASAPAAATSLGFIDIPGDVAWLVWYQSEPRGHVVEG